jgi:hypothetical protein
MNFSFLEELGASSFSFLIKIFEFLESQSVDYECTGAKNIL